MMAVESNSKIHPGSLASETVTRLYSDGEDLDSRVDGTSDDCSGCGYDVCLGMVCEVDDVVSMVTFLFKSSSS